MTQTDRPFRDAPPADLVTPSRRAGLRNEIAAALETADYRMDMRRGDLADAVVPVLYREWPWLRAEAEDAAVLPAPDQQAALERAADTAEDVALRLRGECLLDQMNGAYEVMTELRRLAAEAPQPDTEARPRRGDQFEAWLKAQRDASADYPEAHQVTDGLLNLYRLHADTGTPLGEHVCEGRATGDCECLEPTPAVSQPATDDSEETR
ncbi:hypothetical protein ACWGOK_39265 [Streptomyces eurythermus]